MDCLIDEVTLEAQLKRVSEILQELEELKGLLEEFGETGAPAGSPAGETEPSGVLAPDPRTLGFCAWKLVEEALAIAGLLSFRVAFIQKEPGLSGSSLMQERANEVRDFLEQETEPRIRACRDWAQRYSNVDAADLLA